MSEHVQAEHHAHQPHQLYGHYQFRHPKKIVVNGTELHYVAEGQGTPVVFVHGGLADYRTWRPQMEAFSQRYCAITYSRRAYYPNEMPRDYTSAALMVHVEDLAALITALELGRAHIVANSYGSYISLFLALHHSELVRAMALAEPPAQPLLRRLPGGAELYREFEQKAWEPAGRAYAAGDLENGARLFLEGAVGPGTWEAMPPKVRAALLRDAPEMAVATRSPFEEHMPDFTYQDAARIDAPVLLLRGEKSPRMYSLINNELARCLPHAEQAVVPSAAHVLHNHNPIVHNQIVLQFLAKH